MAKKSANDKNSFRSILNDIRTGKFAPVYLLMGEEAYYIDALVETLEECVVREEEDREFNFTTFYGQDAYIPEVIAACQQYPFMVERRIVLLKEVQSMPRAKSVIDGLTAYIERPNPACVLVITFKGDNINATSTLMKAAAKSEDVVIFKSPRLRDYELTAPISDYCRSKKIAISNDAIEMLTNYIGNDLSALFGAIDKLLIAGGHEAGKITPELIGKNIKNSKEFSTFELQSAIAQKDFTKCMQIVNSFKTNPKANPVVVTVGFLFAFFSKLLIAQMSADKSEAGLMSAVGAKSKFAFRDYEMALQRYNIPSMVNAIHLLRELDVKSKGVGSFQNEHDLLLEFIFNLFAGKGPTY